MPEMKELETNTRENVKHWAEMQESEEQLKIYLPKPEGFFEQRWKK